jgi:hypothetical protein
MASKKKAGGGLRASLAGWDTTAPGELSLDFDPETEDLGLDDRAAASLRRAKGACVRLAPAARVVVGTCVATCPAPLLALPQAPDAHADIPPVPQLAHPCPRRPRLLRPR